MGHGSEYGRNRGRAYCHVLHHQDAQEWVDKLNTAVKTAKARRRQMEIEAVYGANSKGLV